MNEGFLLRKPPAAATIAVWMIDLDRPLIPEADLGRILSIEELNRAERFHYPLDASRFRLCRAMLRLGLAGYLQKSPGKIALTTNPHGKPYLVEGRGLHFNVSHSGRLFFVSEKRDCPDGNFRLDIASETTVS